jgi:hypothetical protein
VEEAIAEGDWIEDGMSLADCTVEKIGVTLSSLRDRLSKARTQLLVTAILSMQIGAKQVRRRRTCFAPICILRIAVLDCYKYDSVVV